MFLPISLSTTGSLLLKLAGTVTTTQPTYSCTYADTLPESIQTVSGNLNNTTAVTAVDSPATGSRIVQQVTVYNKDTENVTLIVEVDDGTPHEYVRITLEPGDFLNKEGVFSSEGFIKAGVRGNTGAVSAAAGLILEHVASPPSTDAEETAIFVDVADGKLYQRAENDGAVTEIGSGVGGSGGPIDLVEVMFYT